ncbi:hypothetical protein HYPSUDRAFT_71449 [Hypholoma sublateritium FD-334 SS-4]|uniref:ABM domain-containing protein n=1 Tax=Hypholoma sublateritium (strain FD-334 SS-4) TaxID=945553 RepID=A0A0D2NI49_HYPSF|nr:hypothetical protein HYPSUDRAFT_71449 [Hypholoma sublateritium FD-334 SS-4]
MPFIELISFVATDFLHEDMSGEDSPLTLLGASEGCLDVVQGRQIENSSQVYFITTWKTYDLYDSATREGGYASFMAYLMHHTIMDPCVHHFEVDGDPHQALAAPVTEIVILRCKSAGDWGWDQELFSGIKGAKKGLNMVQGSYPPLRWGEVTDIGDSGSYCMFVGWDSVQAHFRAVREQPLQRHVNKIRQTTSLIDAKHVIFKSIRRPKEKRYLPERMAGFRIHSSL